MRIVLAGATGFLGRPLLESLDRARHSLTVLTRRPRGLAGIREVRWEPDGSVGAWGEVVDGADAVVNLAGASIAAGRWTAARKAELTESRLLSTRSLVAAIERSRARPALLINSSAVGYYGPHGAEPVTEADGPGDDFLAKLSVSWEHAAQAAEASGTRVVLLRTGIVLERDGGALKPMLLPFKMGVGGPVGDGRQYWPWVHRADWIGLVEFLLAHPSAAGPVNATAPTPVTNEEFSRTLARVLQRPALLRAPAFALRMSMGEMADGLLLNGQRVLPTGAQEMGYHFRYETLEPALRSILQQ